MIPNIDNKNVLILGAPRAGKSTLAKKIKTKHHYLLNTDHFGNTYEYDDALWFLIEYINLLSKKYSYFIVEGTLGYRLLRRLQLLNIKFDLIINVNSNKEITAKQQALHKGNINMYNVFIEAGANIEIININNE